MGEIGLLDGDTIIWYREKEEGTLLRIAVVQMASDDDKSENLRVAKEKIIAAAQAGAELVVLPELFNYLPPKISLEKYQRNAESLDGPTITMVSTVSRESGISIIAGSIIEKSGGQLFNTSCVVTPGGIISTYRKVHLFKFGSINEAQVFSEGKTATIADLRGIRIGLTICFDLRFPEIFRTEALLGARIIVNVAAFLEQTGRAHWMPLLRARAIENQVFILAANQAKRSGQEVAYYGHSCVIDPWGKVISIAGETPELLFADLDLSIVERTRERLPCWPSRRVEAYRL